MNDLTKEKNISFIATFKKTLQNGYVPFSLFVIGIVASAAIFILYGGKIEDSDFGGLLTGTVGVVFTLLSAVLFYQSLQRQIDDGKQRDIHNKEQLDILKQQGSQLKMQWTSQELQRLITQFNNVKNQFIYVKELPFSPSKYDEKRPTISIPNQYETYEGDAAIQVMCIDAFDELKNDNDIEISIQMVQGYGEMLNDAEIIYRKIFTLNHVRIMKYCETWKQCALFLSTFVIHKSEAAEEVYYTNFFVNALTIHDILFLHLLLRINPTGDIIKEDFLNLRLNKRIDICLLPENLIQPENIQLKNDEYILMFNRIREALISLLKENSNEKTISLFYLKYGFGMVLLQHNTNEICIVLETTVNPTGDDEIISYLLTRDKAEIFAMKLKLYFLYKIFTTSKPITPMHLFVNSPQLHEIYHTDTLGQKQIKVDSMSMVINCQGMSNDELLEVLS